MERAKATEILIKLRMCGLVIGDDEGVDIIHKEEQIDEAIQLALSDMTAMQESGDALPDIDTSRKHLSSYDEGSVDGQLHYQNLVVPIIARLQAIHQDELDAVLAELKEAKEELALARWENRDLHCGTSKCWKALNIGSSTGKSISEHIEELKAENEGLKDCLLTRDVCIKEQNDIIAELKKEITQLVITD